MYHKAPSGQHQHHQRGVDVKLLADIGYIADRLRSLEYRWELSELKDLHKRIVLSIDDPPVNVVYAIRNQQLRPVQSDLHGHSQLRREVEQAAEAAQKVEAAKRLRRIQQQQQQQQQQNSCDDENDDDEETSAKLIQLEDTLISFYRSYAEARRTSQKCKKSKKRIVAPSSSLGSLPSPSSSSSETNPRYKCDSQRAAINIIAVVTNATEEPKPEQADITEQEQSFTTSQVDRTMNQDRKPGDPHVATEQQEQAKPPTEQTVTNECQNEPLLQKQPISTDNQSDAKQEEESPVSSAAVGAGAGSSGNSSTATPQKSAKDQTEEDVEEDEDDTTVATTGTVTTATTSSQQTVVNVDADSLEQKRPSLEEASALSSVNVSHSRGRCGIIDGNGDSTDPDEEEEDDDIGVGANDDDAERAKLRKRISELANNFASAKQFQQTCDSIHTIKETELRALIRELKRKIEFAERMNWLCLSSRPRGPPHRKTSLPKHSDVKKRFLEIADTTLSDEVKSALRLPSFDSYEWEDWDVIHLTQTMFLELNLLEKFQIPRETLREWLYEVYKHYNDVPFHNYRHCFCVAQMMYAITWHTNLVQRLGELEVLILLVSCICHDLDHPGYNNIYQINARTELALRYNDISPLENHHCSIAFRLLEHPDCNIFRNMNKDLYKDVREGIIRCILATDMARHNEILTQFQEATPNFDYNNKVHTNLLCMVLIKVADISNEARPMEVAEPWLDRLLQEFFAQSAAEKSEGLPVTPFMDPDKVSKPGSEVRFIGLVLLPLFEALGELLPELTDLIITPVRQALDYYKKLNDVANKTRRSIVEAEQISENSATTSGTGTIGTGGGSSVGGGTGTGSGGSPQLPRSQSGISMKSRPELHDLPEGSESGDSETATEVDVAEKTSKFKVDTESSNRKQSHPNSRKGSREKRPSMIGEYYTTGTRIRGSHGNIQHTNRTYFGSNRAISLDQYSNNRRMSDGIQIQTVASDNSVYYHQRQHRSLEHDSTTGMYSSSDKSTSLNSNSEQQQHPPPSQQAMSQIQPQQGQVGLGPYQSSHHAHLHHHHHHYQQAAAALHQLRTVQDCENMNIAVPSVASGKLYTNLNNNNNSSNNNKNVGKKMNWSQQQKLVKIRNASNNNNNGRETAQDGTSGSMGKTGNGGVNGTNGTTSKSIISRLKQLTGRLSFSFDSKESKKLQLLANASGEDGNESQSEGSGKGGGTERKNRVLEKSKTVDVGGPIAICDASGECVGDFCYAGGVILNQPKSISPILMQHRNSEVISSMNTARNRAYSLDVPISRNCCRSLSGSTAGGGGSSCGGSHKSLTFSLNKSLNEEANDTTISSGIRPPPLDDTTKSAASISETI